MSETLTNVDPLVGPGTVDQPPSTPLEGARLLVVDDVAENVRLVATALRPLGAKVFGFTDPLRARAAVERQRPDLALLDIEMPGMDGFALCSWLKAQDPTRDVPVLFLTASDRQEDKIRAFEVGAVDHVSKPFDLQELVARVSTHVQLSTQRRALEVSNRRLRDAAEFRDQVDAITHHDLKSPLVGVIGFANLLAEMADLDDQARSWACRIQTSGQRMLEQIERTLDLVRIEQGRATEVERVTVATIVEAVVTDLGPLATSSGVDVLSSTCSALEMMAEPHLLRRALDNLVKNAIEAAPMGTEVTVSADRSPRGVTISVSNLGAVPEELRDRFFEKYTTAGKKHGTGLGTYSAAKIIEAMRGSIALDTSVTGRTTVVVELPGG